MKYEKLISVIIPIFNAEKYLENTLKSLLLQNFKNIEFICVNDGSTDTSLEILKKYSNIDNRIKIINKNNGGVSEARNKGLEYCSGKYITFLDADDTINPNIYCKMYKKIIDDKSDMVITGYTKCYESSNVSRIDFNMNVNEEVITNYTKYVYEYFSKYHDNGYLWNKLYKRDIIDEYKLKFDERLTMCEDLLFNLQYLYHTQKVSFINESLYDYNIRYESATYRLHINAFLSRKLTYEQNRINCKKWGMNTFEISSYYSKYPYIYAKEQFLINEFTFKEKCLNALAIHGDSFTNEIRYLIKKKKLTVSRGTNIFYKLNNKILICIYLIFMSNINKFSEKNNIKEIN